MTECFVSYAQNFEDVMLWRALKHVEKGFYVDVGAHSPYIDSVTCVFYDRGWSGINIEPNPKLFEQLQKERPRDINLQVAISREVGTLGIYFFGEYGLSTVEESVAEEIKKEGYETDGPTQVEAWNLKKVWTSFVPNGQQVHFLKVDVEGHEAEVIIGNDWVRNRPWIVLVEAMQPLRQIEMHHLWEPILLQFDYRHAYSDGVNRFYVAAEHLELLPIFRYPPNAFDNFVPHRQAILLKHISQLEKNQKEETNENYSIGKVSILEARADDNEDVPKNSIY